MVAFRVVTPGCGVRSMLALVVVAFVFGFVGLGVWDAGPWFMVQVLYRLIHNNRIVFVGTVTVSQSKGLEFDDVFLVDFFNDSPAEAADWRVLCSFLEERAAANAEGLVEVNLAIPNLETPGNDWDCEKEQSRGGT